MNSSSTTRVNNDSFPVRALIGIKGLFTEKYVLSLFAGYGGSFYEAGDDFDSVIANLEFKVYITPTSNLIVGGERDSHGRPRQCCARGPGAAGSRRTRAVSPAAGAGG